MNDKKAIVWHEGHVSSLDRARLLGQKPATVWLTGLSGAGKSTLAYALEKHLWLAGRACYVLDGDNVRHGLNRDLGFSHEDRTENIRRVAEVARLMNDAGLIIITAFISPYHEDRRVAREAVGAEKFLEVYLSTPLDICEARDPKGFYKRARAGNLPGYTGISAPYEIPQNPSITLDTSTHGIDSCVALIAEIVDPKVGQGAR
jgi:adenylyl-sulfate kinase